MESFIKMVTETLKNLVPPQLPKLKMAESNVRLGAYFIFYLVFVILGAAIFSAIEAPQEIERIRELRRERQKFLSDHPCISGKSNNSFNSLFSNLINNSLIHLVND